MIERVLSNMKVQFFVRLTTALSFAFFTAYQIYMAIQTESNRRGRLIGVGLYLMITAASFFALSYSRRLQKLRLNLMLISLLLLFVLRLLNFPTLIQALYYVDIPSALNFVAYVLPQLGTILLIVMWLNRLIHFVRYQAIVPWIPVTIAIYTLCFAAECVLMIRYGMNIDGGLKLALISRLAYFVGFAGTALSFAFCDPSIFLRAQLHSDRDD